MSVSLTPFRVVSSRIDAATRLGEKAVLETHDGPLSYAVLGAQMLRANAVFQSLGLKSGARVAVFSSDDRAVTVLFFAMLRAGIVPVMGDATASLDELQALCRIADVHALFADAGLLSAVQTSLPVAADRIVQIGAGGSGQGTGREGTGGGVTRSWEPFPEYGQLLVTAKPLTWQEPENEPETALIVFTSGTTAEPKGVMLTYANLSAQLQVFEQVYHFDSDVRLLNALPLHHVDGLIRGPLSAMWFGGTVIRPAVPGENTAEKIILAAPQMSVTHLISVPAQLSIILRLRLHETHQDAFQNPSFRYVICSADHLALLLWQQFEAAFRVRVVNSYGLSEVVCDALFCGPDKDRYQQGTLGKPAGCEALVLLENGSEAEEGESGELFLRGPAVMAGYFNAPDATADVLKDGWFRTGDFVARAPDGFYHFTGRAKTRIVSSGFTIHPEAINAVLLNMPGVGEVATYGAPDPVRGEKVISCVVAVDGFNISVDQVSKYCAQHLSHERMPASVHVLTELPRNPAGKISFEVLREMLLQQDGSIKAGQTGITVYELAAECFQVPADMLSPDSTPFNTDGWDSLAHIELIESVEEAFAFVMSAMEIAMLISLGDLEQIISDHKAN